MPTTSGLGVRTIADIVQLITHCNANQANAAEKALKINPENIEALSNSIGIPIGSVGNDGSITLKEGVKGGKKSVSYVITPGEIIGSPTINDAKRLCNAAIMQSRESHKGSGSQRALGASVGIFKKIK